MSYVLACHFPAEGHVVVTVMHLRSAGSPLTHLSYNTCLTNRASSPCFLPRLRHIQVPDLVSARDTTHSPLLSWNRYSTTQDRPLSIRTFFNLTTSVRISKNVYLKCDLLLISQAGTTLHYHAPILLTEAAMVRDMWESHHKAYYTSTTISHYKVNIITVLHTHIRARARHW
jgi:hypothetical protein